MSCDPENFMGQERMEARAPRLLDMPGDVDRPAPAEYVEERFSPAAAAVMAASEAVAREAARVRAAARGEAA